MSNFTIRVELHGSPKENDYEKLHLAMEAKNLSRSLVDSGTKYLLPHAEYITDKFPTYTATQIVNLTITITKTIWADFEVFVTATQGRWEYYNLRKP